MRRVLFVEEGIVYDDTGKFVDIGKSSFFIKDSRIKPSPAEILISAHGDLSSISEILNKPPLKILDRAQQPVTFGNAQVSGKGRVEVLLKNNLTSDEIFYEVTGRAEKFFSNVINQDIEISDGTLDFFADTKKGLEIKGNAKVKNLPVIANFSGALTKGETKNIEISFDLSEQAMELLPAGIPDIKITGSAPAKLSLKFLSGKNTEFNLTSNLNGVELGYLPIAWVKEVDDEAAPQISGSIGDELVIEDFS
jgi:hypothetical protein